VTLCVFLCDEEILTWKMLYLTWLISMQVFSAAGRFWRRDLNLEDTTGNVAFINVVEEEEDEEEEDEEEDEEEVVHLAEAVNSNTLCA